jgi:hypothetical protein
LISNATKRFLKRAGVSLEGDVENAIVEVEPKLTYQGEGLGEILKARAFHFSAGTPYLINEQGIFPDASPRVSASSVKAVDEKGA